MNDASVPDFYQYFDTTTHCCTRIVIPRRLWTVMQYSLMTTSTYLITVMILSFRTNRSGQTVQTQIRLLLEEQSD